MSAWHRLVVQLNGLVRRRALDRELDEELQYHLERDINRRVAAGESPVEARFAAKREFGNSTLVSENARATWTVRWLEQVSQDVRFALRGFYKARTFVLTVVMTIGLGLGLLTAAFTIFDTYLLRPNAVRAPQTLYELWFLDKAGRSRAFTWNEYTAMREQNPALDDVIAYQWLYSRLDGQPLVFQSVSGNYFTSLSVIPSLGRVLLPSDARAPGGDNVLVLSHQAWAGRFGSDSSIVGQNIRVNGRSFEIVGVAGAGFDGLSGVPPDFWIPITASEGLADNVGLFGAAPAAVLGVLGRLRPGVSPHEARSALASWGLELTRDRPLAQRVHGVRLLSRATPVPMVPLLAQIITPIAVALILVLLIACANVANVMLARGLARQREMGVRLALGAGRGRLVRQQLTESVLLALPASVVAFVLSRLMLGGAVWAMFASVPPGFAKWFRVLPLVPDARVYVFLLLAALVAALAFGLAPALQATREGTLETTHGTFGSSGRTSRLRGILVATQVAVAVLLLICAGVLLRGAQQLSALEPGIRTNGVVQLDVIESARRSVLDVLRSHPAVAGIAASAHSVIDGGLFPQVATTGHPASRTVVSYVNSVSPNFFDELGVALRAGRTFSAEEALRNAPVAVVTEGAVRRYWPDGNAIGASISLTTSDSTAPRSVQVIGVVKDVVPGAIFVGTDVPLVFLPQHEEKPGPLLVRVRGDPARALLDIERALDARAQGAVIDAHSLGEAVGVQTYPFRFGYWFAAIIGAVALLLTASGIYGVVSYLVAQRTKEIGIRLALGASRYRVAFDVARDLLGLTIAGIALGALLALGISAAIASQLVVLKAFDPLAFSGGIAIAFAACVLAGFIPSRRVASVDPMRTLRSE